MYRCAIYIVQVLVCSGKMTAKVNNTLKFIIKNIHKIKLTPYIRQVLIIIFCNNKRNTDVKYKFFNTELSIIFNDYNYTSSLSPTLNQLALPSLEKS